MNLVNIENYEGLYKFDKDLNKIYNVKTNEYIKNSLNGKNYSVSLIKDGKTKHLMLNHLIYKYNNQDNQEDLATIDGYKDYKFNKILNQVINIKSGKYLKNNINSKGYYFINLYKNKKIKTFLIHRLVYKSHNPLIDIKNFDIDHINQDKLNNNINNLRIATRSENKCNIKVKKNNKSTGVKNIFKTKYGKFTVNIMKDRKKYTKNFKSLNEAIEHRDLKLKEIHGEFASF